MGILDFQTALEQMLSHILGDLIASGQVAKNADDLYRGGNSREEAADILEQTLEPGAAKTPVRNYQ